MSTIDPDRVALLPDPAPVQVDFPGQWWPPRWLEPAYVAGHIDEIQLLHLHFGFESIALDDLRSVAAILVAHQVPLVVTAHDLDNPHVADQAAHRAKLGLLFRAASAVITLTEGAAAKINAQWSVAAEVLPHPHVLPIDAVGARRASTRRPVVAMHAKFLRQNVDPWPIMDTLVAAGFANGGTTLRFDLDENALSSPRADASVPGRLAGYQAAGVDVRVHPPFDDAELVDYLSRIDVLVLPYRFGSHSGWVEACFDSGVLTVVPDCGFFAEQHVSPVFGYGVDRFDAAGLVGAVATAVAEARSRTAGADEARRQARRDERRRVRRHVVTLYERVLAQRGAA